ncbi:MAG: TPM domain-containing protein [Clostridia bacterium]|nr:TPM domain-containing protein [Clostridia bacterium]
MKKIFLCGLLLTILCVLCTPAYASFDNPPITDNAFCLTDTEFTKLSSELDAIRKKYNFEVAIYTEVDMTSGSAEASADDIYDYLGYGGGKNDDGIMLYISSDAREYHFTTHGKGIEYFNSNGLAYLESRVVHYLASDDYRKAFEEYAAASQELLEMAANGNPYNKKQYSTKYLIGVVAVCLISPLLIAFWMMKNKLKKMKTAVGDDYAANYQKPGSMRMDTSRDLFLYSRVTKTERAKSNSGTHTSSSGRTHGGRGGSF